MAAEIKYYVGDEGTVLVVSTGNVLTTATLLQLLVQKPDLTEDVWTAAVDGTNNTRMTYTVQNGDFDQVGRYKIQAYVEFATGKWRGNTASFSVCDEFK